MSNRLTRKEIKHDIREDQVKVGIERTFDYVANNSRKIAAAGAAVLLVILAAIGIRWALEERREEGSRALGRAVTVAQAQIAAEGEEPDPDHLSIPTFASEEARREKAKELLQGVVDEHGGTPADVAKVYLARILFDEGDTDGAKALWEEFVDEHPDHMLAASVRVSLLELDKAAGKTEKVVEELRASLEEQDPTIPNDVLLFELGQSLEELERSDEARDAYRRLADEYPDSPYAAQAQQKLRDLEPTAA